MTRRPSPFSPSRADVGLVERLRENSGYLRAYKRRQRVGYDVESLFDEIEEYDSLARRHGNGPLSEARVLEVGFGARPHRLAILHSMGVDARGIDIEVPLLEFRRSRLAEMLRRNGPERLTKSVIRHLLFDRTEWAALRAALEQRGMTMRVDPQRLLIGDAATLEMEPNSVDLIYSEDVFEHIPGSSLAAVTERMARWLAPNGVALISPNVFTGITGGHLVEWNRASFTHDAVRRSAPWDHLRRRAHHPNTQLNELSRAEFRELFASHFVIEDEIVRYPDLGRHHLTAALREELSAWSDDELMSNVVCFVLRPRRT